MFNKPVLIAGIIGFVLGFIIWSNANNVFGLSSLSIPASIFIMVSKIFLGPCPSKYGDFPCEDRIEFLLHNYGILVFTGFLLFCAFIWALAVFLIQELNNKKIKRQLKYGFIGSIIGFLANFTPLLLPIAYFWHDILFGIIYYKYIIFLLYSVTYPISGFIIGILMSFVIRKEAKK